MRRRSPSRIGSRRRRAAIPTSRPSRVTDTVAAINYNKRIITFAAANGQTRKILIDPSVPGLDQVQVGDQVVLLVTALGRGEREDHLSAQLRLTLPQV
jgi:hypothetical protein